MILSLRRVPISVLTVALLAGLGLTVVPSAAASTAPLRTWGVTMPGVPTDLSGLDALNVEIGQQPGVVMWYSAWAGTPAFPASAATAIADRGETPEVTWEPWDPANGVTQSAYSLDNITKGRFDKYLTTWARSIASWGGPLRLRFAHEMNGNWYPWAEGVNGNVAGSYVKAWDHVRSVFAKNGATNVAWVWSPNVPYTGSIPMGRLFPGDTHVDEVALDGYNWGSTQSWSSWTSFADVFGPGLSQLTALSAKPITIGEVASTELGGDKAAWISGMWNTLASWPRVRGIMWFDHVKETDWRIDSSSTSLTAFSQGLPKNLEG